MRNHDFERAPNIAHDRRKRKQVNADKPEPTAGFFHKGLTPELQESLVLYARRSAAAARDAGREALAEQEAEKLARREERVIALLNAAVEHYAYALELFDAWQAQRATTTEDVQTALTEELRNAKGEVVRDAKRKVIRVAKPAAQQLECLRRQIEMRVLALGWTQYSTRWSSKADSRIGTVAHLTALLEEILTEEMALARLKN
jgi:hypothetical protein